MMRLLRSERAVPNKRGRFPSFGSAEAPDLPDYRLMSRFLVKVGLEALVFRTLSVPDWNTEIVDKSELDPLRDYTRFDRGDTRPFAYRTLYPVNAVFQEGSMHYEILHEFDLFFTDAMELYFAIAIFGVEFVVNLGGPHLEGYQKWLEQHNYVSPFYRNAFT